MEWLGNVNSSQVVANTRVNIFGMGGHNHYRNLQGLRIATQIVEDLIAILAGHHHIHENQVGQASRQQSWQLRSIASYSHLKAILRQSKGDNLAYLFIIINHNYIP